jgi:C_GCAxxG_C_C family probable redox protein
MLSSDVQTPARKGQQMTRRDQADRRRAIAHRAGELLRDGWHCSEAVLGAVGPEVIPDWSPAYLRLANGFAGGLGGSQEELCGAAAGAIMVIGARFGREALQDDALAQRLSKAFRERFLADLGETRCGPLRQNVVKVQGGLGSCDVVCERAAMVLLELLSEAGVTV